MHLGDGTMGREKIWKTKKKRNNEKAWKEFGYEQEEIGNENVKWKTKEKYGLRKYWDGIVI